MKLISAKIAGQFNEVTASNDGLAPERAAAVAAMSDKVQAAGREFVRALGEAGVVLEHASVTVRTFSNSAHLADDTRELLSREGREGREGEPETVTESAPETTTGN